VRQVIRNCGFVWALHFAVRCAGAESAPDFTKEVAPIFAKYCSGCHNDTDLEGQLSMASFAKLQKGGERGAVIVPGRADASLMIRMLTGEIEPKMPPDDKPRPTEAEIDVLRAWIDAGAKGPDGVESEFPELSTPKIAAGGNVSPSITSIAISPDGKRLALGRYRRVELVDPATLQVVAVTKDLPGKVNNVRYSRKGSLFVAASGVPGLYGAAMICKAADGAIASQIKGHRDTLYDARISPDGSLLATCSYDRQLSIWDVSTGKLLRTLSGHNGAIFELAFSPDGAVLASASADATVKLWSMKTGERLDTLGQPEGEQSTVAFSPDGNWIVAGGADRQTRMWEFVSRERPQINPLKFSRTAHESSIVRLAFSPDGAKLVTASEGRELVLWDAATLTPIDRYEGQPDVVTGIAFAPDSRNFYVARIDGSWQQYAVAKGDNAIVAGNNEATFPGTSTVAMDEPQKSEKAEQEPNDSPATANQIEINSVISGVVAASAKDAKSEDANLDADFFRFHATKGEQLVLETNADRMKPKSPLDSKLEVLDAGGRPIPRVVLQAVRPSYFTFRGHNSTDRQDMRLHGSADMEFREYVYANGEVMRLWLNPRGPDSGWLVYPGVSGERFTYFGSTAITHPLNEPCYIVEPHRPDEKLIPNGLPQYTLYYENDDDGWRRLGNDSRVAFTAPADGDYLARVTDVRGQGGEAYKYQLTVRPARPDFTVKLTAKDLNVNAGSGKEFTVAATRKDEFAGPIHIDIKGLPPGFHVTTPLVIEADQTTAFATLTADAEAPAPTEENAKRTRLTASAMIGGKKIKKKPIDLGEIKLAGPPKIIVRVLPAPGRGLAQERGLAPFAESSEQKGPVPLATSSSAQNSQSTELVISPGQTIPAIVRVERNGYDGEVKFGTELAGRNLPHGVYVDNIGLNGVTLLKGETERTFFLTARKWVPDQTRQFHLRAEEEGNQTSWPVTLRVRSRPLAGSPAPNVSASSDAK
jgi:dipeptidyl aminopeptidase/acylaminoacyl peptidase